MPVLRALAVLLLLSTGAVAHEAESGWLYDFDCCGSEDCRVAHLGEIEWSPLGWIVHHEYKGDDLEGYQVIPFGDARIRSSLDAAAHVCYSGSGFARCLYLPEPEA